MKGTITTTWPRQPGRPEQPLTPRSPTEQPPADQRPEVESLAPLAVNPAPGLKVGQDTSGFVLESWGDAMPASADSDPVLEPGDRFGEYEIQRLLGEGGMGRVYLARDSQRAESVALKLLSQQLMQDSRYLRRFRHEAGLACRLRHPRIVPIHAYGEHEGRPFFTMAYAPGRTLREVLEEDGPLHPLQAGQLIAQVAHAIDAAHRQRVVHRDLKPANVVVDPDEGPLVLDFGLARQLGRKRDVTASGEILGTPAFMAPEQILDEDIDHRVDVYALGGMLYNLLTGVLPHDGESVQSLLGRVLRHEPPTAPRRLQPGIPRQLEAIVIKAMEPRRIFRFQSAADLAEELERFLAGERVRTRRPGPLARAWRAIRIRPWATTAVLGLALLTGAVWSHQHGQVEARAIRARSAQAGRILESARAHERAGRPGAADQSYLEAMLVAEGAYLDAPHDKQVQERYVHVLEAWSERALAQGREPVARELNELARRVRNGQRISR